SCRQRHRCIIAEPLESRCLFSGSAALFTVSPGHLHSNGPLLPVAGVLAEVHGRNLPATADAYSTSINWKDGNPVQSTIDSVDVVNQHAVRLMGSHTFAKPGEYG